MPQQDPNSNGETEPAAAAPAPRRIKAWQWLTGAVLAILVGGAVGTAGAINLSSVTTATTPTPKATQGATQSPLPAVSAAPGDRVTYLTVIVTHATALSALFDTFNNAVAAEPADETAARAAMQGVMAEVLAFRADLDRNLPPAELAAVDEDVRLGLDDYGAGAQLVVNGIDRQDASVIRQGIDTLKAGDQHLNDANVHLDAVR